MREHEVAQQLRNAPAEQREKIVTKPNGTYGGYDVGLNSNGHANDEKKQPLVETMSSVEEEQIDFLWKNRIPRGKLTLFDGDPGIGKSYTALSIAGTLSNGLALPFDEEPEAPLRSLIISAEDGPADTVKPRLRKLKADMDMIAIPHRAMGFTPSAINATLIERMLREFPAALVVIDPVIAFASRRNTDKAGDVRDLLTPLALLAEKHKVAIILIRHLNKATQSKALYRGQGSMDFAAVCRSAFIFAQDPANDERRLMAHTKSSLAGLQPTLEFFINSKSGEFSWGGETSDSADDALGTGEPRKEREAQRLDAAKRFLERALESGPAPSNDIKEKAAKAGIAWRTVWRAKEELEVKASKARGSGEWFWRLS
jgi:archaellum biogenesis ATPase FlaH